METIFKRRSVRKYTETPVTDVQIKQIIRAGMAAPSAKNSQEWVFVVLRDPEIYKKFSEVHVNAFCNEKQLRQPFLSVRIYQRSRTRTGLVDSGLFCGHGEYAA